LIDNQTSGYGSNYQDNGFYSNVADDVFLNAVHIKEKEMKCKFLQVTGFCFLSFVLFSMICRPVEAGDAVEIEQMVVTSTMTAKEIGKVPDSIQVITQVDIKQMGAKNAAEALADATGLDLDKVAGRGTIPQIRGLTNKRTLILIDGMRFSTGFRDTTVDLTEFPADIIKRIEVVRGPASSLYGSEAMGGVINIITRDVPKETTASLGTSYGANTYGDGGRWNTRGTIGSTKDKFGIMLSATSEITDQFDPDANDAMTEIDDEERFSATAKLQFTPSDGHKITGGAMVTETTREGLRPKYNLSWDRDAESSRISSYLQYDGNISNTQVMARSYYSFFNLDRSYIDIGSPYTSPSLQKIAKAQPDREDFDIDTSLWQHEIRGSRLLGSHMVTLGGEFRQEKREGIENRGEIPIDETIYNTGLFLQDDFSLLKDLQLVLGLRFDDHSDFGNEFSPRVSMIYAFNQDLRVKASYGEGFRAPSLYELYVDTENSKGDVIANPDLNPESAKSFDIGLEGEWKKFMGKLTLFRNNIEDMIYKRPTGNYRMQGSKKVLEYALINLEDAVTQGIEAEITFRLTPNLRLSATSTYIDSENESTDEELLEVPEWKNALKLSYDNTSRDFHINIRMNHFGEQLFAPKLEDSPGEEKGAYTLFHIYASKKIRENLEFYGGINNIFNEKPDFDAAEAAYYYCGINFKF